MENRVYNDFAWECLRRNPRYIKDWEFDMEGKQKRNLLPQEEFELTQSESDLQAEDKWGLLKYISPSDPNPTNVFWSPRLSNRSASVTLSNSGKSKGGYTWGDMSNVPGVKRQFLRMHDDTLCVKIFNQKSYFQLFIENSTTLTEDSGVYINIPLHHEFDSISKSIEILQRIVNPKTDAEDKNENYLSLLKTVDYIKKGFSHRDIASILFGDELVNSEWSADSWVRAKIRYRIKKANDLINHGYLNFL